jgi:hypothetical protein
MKTGALLRNALLLCALSACDELKSPPPAAPIVPPVPPSQFAIAGRWDGVTEQGRPLRFDVSDSTVVVNGSLTLHHDCTGGRLVLDLGSFQADVNRDSFSVTMNWRRDEATKYYTGILTVAGRFEGDRLARGGFVNSVTDKQVDDLGVCPSSSGSWEASRN